VTDVLADYAQEHGQDTVAPWRIAAAIKPLVGFWKGRTVADVTRETCRAYTKAREGRSAGTVRRELGVLRAAINHSHREGRITRMVAVHLPDRPPPRDRWLTPSEAGRLIGGALGFTFVPYSDARSREIRYRVWDRERAHARLHLPLFILIGLYTGRRKEAILSLRWPQVNLEARTIDFELSGRRRTNKKRGIVRIPSRLLPHLQRASKRGTELGYVLHVNGERIGDIKKGFAAACKRAGIEGASPHTLKHTAATWLMQAGTDPWEAAGFLSISIETLLRVYGHHHPDYQHEAAENIGRKRPRNVRIIA
jgi:integrase